MRAVVFDFGGVMTLEPDRKTIVQFLCKTFNLTDDEFEVVNRVKRQAVKAGITDEEFWLSLALERGIELPPEWPAKLKSVMKNALNPNPAMFQLVDQLKEKQIPVTILSNIDDRLANQIKKRDPKAFEYLIQKLGVPAAQIVFIDDLVENIEAAQSLGLDAIRFESFEQIRNELIRRGFL